MSPYVLVVVLAFAAGASCRPSDVLSVPPPIGVLASATDHAGAEGELAGATGQLSVYLTATGYLFELSGLMSDELTYADYYEYPSLTSVAADSRNNALGYLATTGPAVGALGGILGDRSRILVALAALQQYEPPSGRGFIGRAYALAGYTELLLAENFCAGVPLGTLLYAGGYVFGAPLTTDSLLGTAEAHFTAAVANAGGNDTTLALASVGLGRAALDRGQFAAAAKAVSGVPVGFVYGMVSAANFGPQNSFNFYADITINQNCPDFNVADREGENGVNFVSAGDPRLQFDTTFGATCDGGTWYYPQKFGSPPKSIPIATGVEAELIAAEAALHSGDVAAWAADLNALRAQGPSTYLQLASAMNALTADSTTAASDAMRVNVMFRERAFWLYGTGTRLGDLRRLIRQYARGQSTVFPTGPYVGGESPQLSPPVPNYGQDVSFMIPTQSAGQTSNPYYKGCLSPPSTA
jgi:hypothetical protein